MNIRLLAAAAALPLLALPTAAFADEEEATGAWEIDGEVGVLSDYRFRGISLSGKDPEVTAELSVSHESGFYAAVWASNVDLGSGADDLETDFSLGFSKDAGGVNFDIGGVYYVYPGNSTFNYAELYGSIGVAAGPGEVRVGVAYAPAQDNIGSVDNTYVYISGDMPIGETPLSVHGTFGIEDGAFGDNKKDWLIGASYDLGHGITASLDYIDTAHALTTAGDATAVASLKFAF